MMNSPGYEHALHNRGKQHDGLAYHGYRDQCRPAPVFQGPPTTDGGSLGCLELRTDLSGRYGQLTQPPRRCERRPAFALSEIDAGKAISQKLLIFDEPDS